MKHTPLYTDSPMTYVVAHVEDEKDSDGDLDLQGVIQFVRGDSALVLNFSHFAFLSNGDDPDEVSIRINGQDYDPASDIRREMGAVLALADAVAEFKDAYFKAAENQIRQIEEANKDV